MSNVSKRRREGTKSKIKSMGDHKEFLKRITKTLSYGQLPPLPCLSLPVTELSCELWSGYQRGRSLRRLHADAAAAVARQACVSPCALVLAILYLERLHANNPHYLAATPPFDLFLVSLMVGNKFLQDDGEDDEVIISEWAASGGLKVQQLKKLEVDFLNAIDWKVFVSEKSFETGLQWLERQVCLRQARARGFFTYTELAAGAPPARPALPALAALLALPSLLAAALLAAHCLAALASPASPVSPVSPASPSPPHGLSVSTPAVALANVSVATRAPAPAERMECCAQWWTHRHRPTPPPAPPPPCTVLGEWLYRTSLVDPLQRWLDIINEYTDYLQLHFGNVQLKSIERCNEYAKSTGTQHFARQRLNLSKLGALVVSVSDR